MPPVYKKFIEKNQGVRLSISAQHSDRGYEYVSKDLTDIGFIATDMYFKALFLDITIHSKSKYTIHWFDDVYTKVILRNTGGNITHA